MLQIFFYFTENLQVDGVFLKFFISKIIVWTFKTRSCNYMSCYWRPEVRDSIGDAKSWLAVVYPLLEHYSWNAASLDSSGRYAEVQASKLSWSRKKNKASKHSRHINKTHAITSYFFPDLNKFKKNVWDLEILLSARISQLSWSIKGGDGM